MRPCAEQQMRGKYLSGAQEVLHTRLASLVPNSGGHLVQVELDLQAKMKHTEHRRTLDTLNNVTKEKDNLLKRYKKMENILKVTSSILPDLQVQKHDYKIRGDLQKNLMSRQQAVRPSPPTAGVARDCAQSL